MIFFFFFNYFSYISNFQVDLALFNPVLHSYSFTTFGQGGRISLKVRVLNRSKTLLLVRGAESYRTVANWPKTYPKKAVKWSCRLPPARQQCLDVNDLLSLKMFHL